MEQAVPMLGVVTDLPQQIASIIILSLAVSSVSLTMTKAKLTKPLRNFVRSRSEWLGELFSCPYCFSHWVSFGAVAAARPVVTSTGLLLADLLISAFAVISLAALTSGLVYRSIELIPESRPAKQADGPPQRRA